MARHYYRTNVPLPVMILKWIAVGVFGLCFFAYDSCFNAPKREAERQAQAQWDRERFNGWRLTKQTYDTQHGLFFDELNKHTCTTLGYPGYPACPAQRYYANGQPQSLGAP